LCGVVFLFSVYKIKNKTHKLYIKNYCVKTFS